jgi:hypothetical protein
VPARRRDGKTPGGKIPRGQILSLMPGGGPFFLACHLE